jgi:hypothetical protein
LEDGYHLSVIVYFVDYAIVVNAQTQALSASKLATVVRTRIIRKGLEGIFYAVLCGCREPCNLFLRPPLNAYRVGHQSPVTFPSRISRMA